MLNTTRITFLDVPSIVSFILAGLIQPAAIIMGLLFLVILIRPVLRNTVMAAASVVALVVFLSVVGGSSAITATSGAIAMAGLLWTMLRFGILPGPLLLIVGSLLNQVPLTSDLSAWYASRGLFIVALTLALAVWSFRHALGGRTVLRGDFLDG